MQGSLPCPIHFQEIDTDGGIHVCITRYILVRCTLPGGLKPGIGGQPSLMVQLCRSNLRLLFLGLSIVHLLMIRETTKPRGGAKILLLA